MTHALLANMRQSLHTRRRSPICFVCVQFSRVRGLCDFVLNTALLAGGFLPWSWRLAESAVGVLGWPSEVAQSVAWALIQVCWVEPQLPA